MTNQKLEILLSLRDEASKKLKNFQNLTGKATAFMKKNWLLLTAGIAATILVLKKLGDALVNVMKSLIDAANKVEQLQVRLKVLLGSVEKGNELFENMAALAGRVPKTFEEIMSASTDLAAVVRDGVKEVTELMPIVVDISAATGIAIREVNSQIIRMYSAGAAAADLFRERGVSAALGFKAGVSVTAEETMEILTKQWEDGTGKFVGASEELATTFTGMTSMMQDAWFMFKVAVSKEMFESIKFDLKAVLELINESKEEGGKYNEVVEKLSKSFNSLLKNSVEFVASMLVGVAQIKDIWNELQLAVSSFLAGLVEIRIAILSMAKFVPFADKDVIEAQKEEMLALLIAFDEENRELAQAAAEDQSTLLREGIDEFIAGIEERKEAFIAAEEEKREQIITTGEEWIMTIDNIAAKEQVVNEARKKAEASFWRTAGQMKDQFAAGMTKMSMDIIKGTFDAKKAFAQLGEQMIESLINYLIQQQINNLFAKTAMATQLAASTVVAAATAAAWAPAAAMVSLATSGANSIPASTGIASTTALAQALAIPTFAEGGIVDKPTFALIGEKGPEAIIPLSKGGGRMSQFINIEINNPVVRSDEDMDNLTEEISLKLAQETERI